MALSINSVEIIGHVVRHEVKAFSTGNELVTVTVVTKNRYKKKDSVEWSEDAEFHTIKISYPNIIKRIKENGLDKGDYVRATGAIKTHKYTNKEGVEKSEVQITCESFLRLQKATNSYKTAPQEKPTPQAEPEEDLF